MINYRKAIAEDRTEVLRLYAEFVNEPGRYSNGDQDSYFSVLNSQNTRLLLALDNNKIVGFVSYSQRTVIRYPKPIVEVEELYVSPEFRGNGIAKQLMALVEQDELSRQSQYIFVGSSNNLPEAHELYKRLGYDQYGKHFRMCPNFV